MVLTISEIIRISVKCYFTLR